MSSGLLGALGLENLHNDLLLLNEEGPHDLLPDGLVAQHAAVGPEDGLLAAGHPCLLLVGGRLDTLQLEAGHGALRDCGALLQVLHRGEGDLASTNEFV